MMMTQGKNSGQIPTSLQTKVGIVLMLGLLIIGLCVLAIASCAQSEVTYNLNAGEAVAVVSPSSAYLNTKSMFGKKSG
ncbi:MAG: hypothetical protein AAF944_22620 [Bacteroidota bacterium]